MCGQCGWANCIIRLRDGGDYNPDTDITLYNLNELLAMYRRVMEFEGKIARTSLLVNTPFFTRDELREEINSRAIGFFRDGGQYDYQTIKSPYFNIRECVKENFVPMIKPLWESFRKNNIQVEIVFWITGDLVWINVDKKWLVKNV